MFDALEAATRVATPLALLAFLAVLGYLAYARHLKYQEKKLEALPPDQVAIRTDEYLTRYGIDGKKLPIADKLALIKDEMDKRHRRLLGYAMLAAVVFIFCFGWAVAAYVVQLFKVSPGPEPQTTLRVIDSLTKDPVYRPLNVVYGLKPVALSEPGRITLAENLADIDLDQLKIACPGYSFDAANQPPRAKEVLELARVVDQGDLQSFSRAITPGEGDIPWVSLAEYREEVKDQVADEGVQLRCINRTGFHVNLVLFPWIPMTEGVAPPEFPPDWQVLAAPCPGKREKTYRVNDFNRGVYYYIFGSACGLKATPLVSGNLHRNRPIVLEIFDDHDPAMGPVPKLRGRIVDGDAE